MSFSIRRATLADAAEIGCVHALSWRETYKGLFPPETVAEIANTEKMIARHTPALEQDMPDRPMFVAEMEEGRMVGVAAIGPVRKNSISPDISEVMGEVYLLYLLDEAKRQGIGREIMLQSAAFFLEQGKKAMLAVVLATNEPACLFYEKLGGVVEASGDVTIVDKSYLCRAYVWRDLSLFLEGTKSDG